MKISASPNKVGCIFHGTSSMVFIEHADALGFNHKLEVCKRCADEAIEQYQEVLVCAECGSPVEKGNGVERDGVMTPLCKPCQAKWCVANV